MNSRCVLVVALFATAGTAGSAQAAFGDLYIMTGAGFSPSDLWKVDKSTAISGHIGGTGNDGIRGIDFDPTTGIMYAHRNRGGPGELYTVNPTTAALSFIGTTNIQSPDMSFDSAGNLYAWAEYGSGAGDDMVAINKSTGAVTLLGDSGVGTARTGLFTDSSGSLYMKNYDASLYLMNPGTGGAAYSGTISGVTTGDTNNPTDVDPTTGYMYMIDRQGGASAPSVLYRVDLGSLTATQIGTIVDGSSGAAITNISGLAFEVPAPGSLALLGLGGLAAARRRRA